MLQRRLATCSYFHHHFHSNLRSNPNSRSNIHPDTHPDIHSLLLSHLKHNKYPEFNRILLNILPIHPRILPPIIQSCNSPKPLECIFNLIICAKIPFVDTINHLILGRAIKLRHVSLVKRIIESTPHPPAALLASAFEFLLCFQHKSKTNDIHPSKPLRSIFMALDPQRLNDALRILIARIQTKRRHNAWNIDHSHVLIKTIRYFNQTVIDLDVQALIIGQFLNNDTSLLIKFLNMSCFRNEVIIGTINHHLRLRRFHFSKSQVMSTENPETMLNKQVSPPQFFAQAILILIHRPVIYPDTQTIASTPGSTKFDTDTRPILSKTIRSFLHEIHLEPMFEFLFCLTSADVALTEPEMYIIVHGLTILRSRFDLAYDVITKSNNFCISPRIYRTFIQSSSLLCPKYTFSIYKIMVKRRIKPSKALLNHMAVNFARAKGLGTTNATHLIMRILCEFKRLNYFGSKITAGAILKIAVLRGERISTERWKWALSVARMWISRRSMVMIGVIAKKRYNRVMTVVKFSRKYKYAMTMFTRVALREMRCTSNQRERLRLNYQSRRLEIRKTRRLNRAVQIEEQLSIKDGETVV
ncbi:hypothetical protein NEOLI_001216 [Neolecta irregularis DAH-3]|uniref:Uncharacterized protein n=1 Tax=Neolecta irregularis (strain DAH-3) TaxID=1198029 RepID=A0A1U7LS73_NEOID|nr:hypothetical protein NEOLI_001216 [Neolecta irregularis DAH-3]|eukprot:OLL25392.1 hypothetical protein NEOLI_001216 [Neolecta irregularis DAH-3]